MMYRYDMYIDKIHTFNIYVYIYRERDSQMYVQGRGHAKHFVDRNVGYFLSRAESFPTLSWLRCPWGFSANTDPKEICD